MNTRTIVDIIVSPLIRLLNLLLQLLWKEFYLGILLRQNLVKTMIEHSDDLGGLVVHNTLLLLVVQSRHREAATIVLVVLEVDLADVSVLWMYRIGLSVRTRHLLVLCGESPAWSCQLPDEVDGRRSSPFSPICQCTEVYGMMSSRPFSLRTMSARCAAVMH